MSTSFTTAKKFVNKLQEDFIKLFTMDSTVEVLIGQYNAELGDIYGYHGREILELLQNADDAYQKSIDSGYKPKEPLKVLITYRNNILTVQNTGTTFDEAGVVAVTQGRNSSKNGNYIGNKGTGFRSLLNWADDIEIHSGYYHIKFSEKIANEILEQIKHKGQIKKQLEKKPNLYIPMLCMPKYIENQEYFENKTEIKIHVKSEREDDNYSVIKQLETIDLHILLFLPNISEIIIETDESNIIYKKIEYGNDEIDLIKNVNNNEHKESFYIKHKNVSIFKGSENNKELKLSIAVPKDFSSFKLKHLYTYFPLLNAYSPFNCILHAPYNVDAQRNNININNNEDIIKEQLQMLVEFAKEFINKGNYDIGYNMLIPINYSTIPWEFNNPFSKFNVEQYFIELLCNEDLFVTVNNDIISIKNGAKYIKYDYPAFFKGDIFSYLIKNNSNIEKLINLIENYDNYINITYNHSELCSLINNVSNTWVIEEQVETFIWWNKYYKNVLPMLLKNNNDTWLQYKEQCYLLEGNMNSQTLPRCVKIPSLQTEYQDELVKQYRKLYPLEKDLIRKICKSEYFPNCEFKYTDARSIISVVNSSVNDDYNNAVEFVIWLWDTYKDQTDTDWLPYTESNDQQPAKFNFPNINSIVVKTNKLFFGSNYGNKLGDKLFDESYSMFLHFSVFGIQDVEKEQFIRFISKFGVCYYPKLELKDFHQENVDRQYYNENYDRAKTVNIGSSNYIIKFRLKYINNLIKLLESKLTLEEIILWVHKDKDLSYHLDLIEDVNSFQYRKKNGYTWYDFPQLIKPINYIRYIFNNFKWISMNDNKYCPTEVIYNISSKKRVKLFKELVPTITYEYVEAIAKKCQINFDDVVSILDKFSFCKEVTSLQSSDFYNFMLKLSEQPNYTELYQEVYRLIENIMREKEYNDSENKSKFLNEGKLLVKKGGKYVLSFAKETYVPSTKIINSKDKAIVAKSKKTGNKNFINIFGCQEYKKMHKVQSETIIYSPINNEFQEYFGEFKKYLKPFFEYNSNIKIIYNKIKINLVQTLSVVDDENNVEQIEEEFSYFRDDKSASTWYVTFFKSNIQASINDLSKVIGDIYNHIANSDGFDYKLVAELFRSDKDTRRFLIEDNFNYLDILDEEEDINNIKNSFINTLNKICPEVNIDRINIDFENFNNNSNNYQKIIQLFKKLKIDILDFKNHGFVYPINLKEYYKKLLKEYVKNEEHINQYMNYLYTKSLNSKELQMEFIQNVKKFENFDYEYDDSVNIDYKAVIFEQFGDYTEISNDKIIDASKEYKKNFVSFDINDEFKSVIQENLDIQNMIYFNKKDEFKIKEKEFLELSNKDRNKDRDIFKQYKNISPIKKEVAYSGFKNNVTYQNINFYSGIPRTSVAYINNHIEQKALGNIGELLIYDLLCQKFGKGNVKPCSEAFIDLGIILHGQASASDYDIKYTENDVTYYVEVKTGHSNSFYMSNKELQFAKNNADRYKLFLVYDIKDKAYTYTELPNRFWEDTVHYMQIPDKIKFEF